MKTGMTRPVDSLGRIVIPKEIRNTFNLVEGTKIELAVEGDRIIITKSENTCNCCENEASTEVLGIKLCNNCLESLKRAVKKINSDKEVI